MNQAPTILFIKGMINQTPTFLFKVGLMNQAPGKKMGPGPIFIGLINQVPTILIFVNIECGDFSQLFNNFWKLFQNGFNILLCVKAAQ